MARNREKVLKKYPKAFSESCGPDIRQIVNPKKFGKVDVLGQGRTIKDAWYEAARKIIMDI